MLANSFGRLLIILENGSTLQASLQGAGAPDEKYAVDLSPRPKAIHSHAGIRRISTPSFGREPGPSIEYLGAHRDSKT